MKNISRRVFIKGMAVAAVATAASTVLAGCNFVPGTVEETPVAGFQPETKTLSYEDDKSFTVGVTGFATAKKNYQSKYNELGVVSLHLVNEMGHDVIIDDTTYYSNYMSVQAFVDSKGDRAYSDKTGRKNDLYHNTIASNSVTLETVVDGNLYFTLPEEWNKLTLVFKMKEGTETETVEFVINNN